MTTDVTPQTSHPLARFGELTIETWPSWKKAWDRTKTDTEAIGLIYQIFNVRAHAYDERVERIAFLLDAADSWNTWDDSTRYRSTTPAAAMRKRLGLEALKQLAKHFFKNTEGEGMEPSWVPLAYSPELIDKIIWFLRTSSSQYDFHNLSRYDQGLPTHLRDVSTAFAFEFARLAWDLGELDFRNRDMIECIKDRRPQLVPILVCFGTKGMDVLEKLPELDAPTEAKLTELALATMNHKVPNCTPLEPCTTLEQAYANRSLEARVLILQRVRKEQNDKLRELNQAEIDRADARRRQRLLEELRGSTKQNTVRIAELATQVQADIASGLLPSTSQE